MGRRATIVWHAALSVAAGVLYFFFVLPRWPELNGDTSHGLGTAARIVTGFLLGLAGLPVVFSLVQLRKPEFGTPALALNLRTGSVVAHVTAGVLIVGTAISEIWLSLDSVGQWLFGVYGAAAAVALLGIAALYLSYVAEQPPPPPKPLKPKKEKRQLRGRSKTDEVGEIDDDVADAEGAEETDEPADEDTTETDTTATAADDETQVADHSPDAETTAAEVESTAEESAPIEETDEAVDEVTAAAEAADDTAAPDDTAEADSGGLRNRRPIGKGTHRRRRARRGIAVDE